MIADTQKSEANARSAIERAAGTTFTDSEWRIHRERLFAYIQLLRSWDAKRSRLVRNGAAEVEPAISR